MNLNFNLSRKHFDLVCEIADRADASGLTGPHYQRMTLVMDLAACHNHSCALDFERLAKAKGFDFNHDIAGIARHIDRTTGLLKDSFRPRFALRDHRPDEDDPCPIHRQPKDRCPDDCDQGESPKRLDR